MKPNSRRLNKLADKEMHKKYLIAHNEYAVDDYKDGYQQAFDDLMAVVIMQREALVQYVDGRAYDYDRAVRGEVMFNATLSAVTARQALAESSKLLAELTEGNE